MKHDIENPTAEHKLGCLVLGISRRDVVSQDGFVTKHRIFNKTSEMVTREDFPKLTTMSTDPSHVFIPGIWSILPVSMKPDPCRLPGRDEDGRNHPSQEFIVDLSLVIRTIGMEACDLCVWILLFQKRLYDLAVMRITIRDFRRSNLSILSDTDMDLLPGSAFPCAVLADFPFSFPIDFHTG